MKISLAALLTGSVLLAGCGAHEEDRLIGKWKATVPTLSAKDKSNPMAAFGQALAGSFTVEFKKDKTFAMMAMIVPIEGTWSVSGNTVSLHPNKVMGLSPMAMDKETGAQKGDVRTSSDDKPMTFELSDDGKTLTPSSPKKGDDSPTLVKESP